MTATDFGYDPTDPAFVADPYPVYARLREHGGLHRYEPHGFWLVPRHGDVDRLLRDRRLGRVFTPREPRDQFAPWNLVNEHSMLELEPPDHTRLRRLVASEFTPRRVEKLRGRVRALIDRLFDEATESAEADLMRQVAEPLPVQVIAELLGIPEADRHRLRPWSNDIVSLYELEPATDAPDRAVRAAAEFVAYMRELIARRRRVPTEDLLSALAGLTLEGEQLAEDELVATAVLLLNAGHEASVNVLGNGLVALLRNPAELARLRDHPGLVPAAVEELIRFDTPLSLFTRTVFKPVEVDGQALEPGTQVALLLGSANRDGAVFDRPDVLDVGRTPNPHVGFGAGIHYCLGAPLARLELQEALGLLLERFGRIELTEAPVIRPTYQFRGHMNLKVRLAPR